MANLKKIFQSLVAQPPLLVGAVTSNDGVGMLVVQLPDGSLLRARGDASVATQVFVRDGVVQGPAPALPIELIEI